MRELEEIDALVEVEDRKNSKRLVDARQRMVELEEQLRQAGLLPDLEAVLDLDPGIHALRAEATSLQNFLAEGRQKIARPDGPSSPLQRIEQQLGEVQKKLKVATDHGRARYEVKVRSVVDLRKQIVQLEDEIGSLERERATRRADSERRREAAFERLLALEGIAPESGDRFQRATQRKLDDLQREVAEVRRELKRLRAGKKE
jgi:hypothetical protein